MVGEETGKLPEVMADLERYYEHHQRQQRQLVGQAMKPLIQYVLAVLVVSGLILFLSFLPSTRSSGGVRKQAVEVAVEGGGTKTVEAYLPVAYDPLGLGLTGERGAVQFLLVGFATPLLLWLAYRLCGGRSAGGRWWTGWCCTCRSSAGPPAPSPSPGSASPCT